MAASVGVVARSGTDMVKGKSPNVQEKYGKKMRSGFLFMGDFRVERRGQRKNLRPLCKIPRSRQLSKTCFNRMALT